MQLTNLFQAARTAARKLIRLDESLINRILNDVADAAIAHTPQILAANAQDLAQMEQTNPMYDRLLLNQERLASIAQDLRNVALLPSPLGKVLDQTVQPNGMTISKVTVPMGVIGIIYEARPNVTFDVFALCLKSGNATLLKGGTDADQSNKAIVRLIRTVLEQHGVDPNSCTLLPPDRAATAELLQAVGYVDMIIPRGSQGLISFVRDNSRVPVIETGAGICHTYFDASGDLSKGKAIIFNSKTRRVSVCNTLDCLILHRSRLSDLTTLCSPLAEKNVILYADTEAFAALNGTYPANLLQPATEDCFGIEFLDYKMSIKTVEDIDEALTHIAHYSSMHSEAIVAEATEAIDRFLVEVDAACVYANVSTSFTDGAQFGFGAEIGISTQKLHARGPMALPELTSYKYIIIGNGQTRS